MPRHGSLGWLIGALSYAMRRPAQGSHGGRGGRFWRGLPLRGRGMLGRGREGKILLFLRGEEVGGKEGKT
jgi:hypothetical protein